MALLTLVLLRVVAWLIVSELAVSGALSPHTRSVVLADVFRYQTIAFHHGIPYRDFPVEYPPVLLGAIKLLVSHSVGATLLRVGAVGLLLDLAIAGLLKWGWGEDVALAYLIVGAPLALFIYFHFDLLSVALAVAAFALLRRDREWLGGASLAMAVLTKVWPIVLVPALVARRAWRALAAWAILMVVAGAAWLSWAGWHALVEVLTFRGAHGWEFESLVGSLVWVATGATLRLQGGALRVGSVDRWATGAAVVAVLAVAAVAWAVRSRGDRGDLRPEGYAATAAVGGLMLASPLLSAQYLCWPLPWVAAGAVLGDRLLLTTMALAAGLTTLIWFLPSPGIALTQTLVVARNAALLFMMATSLARLARVARDRPLGGDANHVDEETVRGT